jgi:hypothetical protein
MILIHNHGERSSFLYLEEKIRKASNPICNSSAVYLLLNANPIAIPARIQCHFFSSKIALYKNKIVKVQNSSKGTSGVELKDRTEIKIVDVNTIKLLNIRCFERKREDNL